MTNLSPLYLRYLGVFALMRGAYMALLLVLGAPPSAASTLITATAPAAIVGHLFRGRFGRPPAGLFGWKLAGVLAGIWVLVEVMLIMVLAGPQVAALGAAWAEAGPRLLLDPVLFVLAGLGMMRLFLWLGGRVQPRETGR